MNSHIHKTKRALLSVSDKSGIEKLASSLVEIGWEILSTGGTARVLRDAGVQVTEVSQITDHPEIMDGRVKTLHPAIHAGILARRDRPEDMAALDEHKYHTIDLVAVNLYPFRETVARSNVLIHEAMDKVDIGGPTLIRASAKNHTSVLVLVDPSDYDRVLNEISDSDITGVKLRRELAAKVFRHISEYDSAVAAYLEAESSVSQTEVLDDTPVDDSVDLIETEKGFSDHLSLGLKLSKGLRYGENPGQEAAFYQWSDEEDGLVSLQQLHGKELSYNNLLDIDGALLSLAPFSYSPKVAVCITKHTTPCGLAVADTLVEAYEKALRTDNISAFGSVIAVNRRIDEETAKVMSELFIECIVAPGFDEDAIAILMRHANLRILTLGGVSESVKGEPDEDWWKNVDDEIRTTGRFLAEHGRRPESRIFRTVYGGMLVQTPPSPPFYGIGQTDWSIATERHPDKVEWDDMCFAWAAVFGVKSNAILLASDGATLGIGAGQMSRVDSSRIAVQKAGFAGLDLNGSVMASDAFFPFRDGIDAAADVGVKAIIQPGGSIRDAEVIEAANEHGMAMVFTGKRLFRH